MNDPGFILSVRVGGAEIKSGHRGYNRKELDMKLDVFGGWRMNIQMYTVG